MPALRRVGGRWRRPWAPGPATGRRGRTAGGRAPAARAPCPFVSTPTFTPAVRVSILATLDRRSTQAGRHARPAPPEPRPEPPTRRGSDADRVDHPPPNRQPRPVDHPGTAGAPLSLHRHHQAGAARGRPGGSGALPHRLPPPHPRLRSPGRHRPPRPLPPPHPARADATRRLRPRHHHDRRDGRDTDGRALQHGPPPVRRRPARGVGGLRPDTDRPHRRKVGTFDTGSGRPNAGRLTANASRDTGDWSPALTPDRRRIFGTVQGPRGSTRKGGWEDVDA